MNRRKILAGFLAAPAALSVAGESRVEHYRAMWCGNESFGSKVDDRVRCGKWAS